MLALLAVPQALASTQTVLPTTADVLDINYYMCIDMGFGLRWGWGWGGVWVGAGSGLGWGLGWG